MTGKRSAGYKKRRRMIIGGIFLIVLGVVTLLVRYSLDGNAFKQPAAVSSEDKSNGRFIRIGGLVKVDSLHKLSDGLTSEFLITDCNADVRVRYTGITPALFREGQGVIADGKFDSNGFLIASKLLAKHDENYQARGMEVKSNAGICAPTDHLEGSYTSKTSKK